MMGEHVISLEALVADGYFATIDLLRASNIGSEAARGDQWGPPYSEVARVVPENRDEIVARFPAILRRVSGYNLDEFVAECRNRLVPPPSVERVRRIDEIGRA